MDNPNPHYGDPIKKSDKDSRRTRIIIVVGIAVLAVYCGGLYLFFRYKDSIFPKKNKNVIELAEVESPEEMEERYATEQPPPPAKMKSSRDEIPVESQESNIYELFEPEDEGEPIIDIDVPSGRRVPPGPLRVGGDVKAPIKIKEVPPIYPQLARQARIQGIVIVEAIIDKEGNVTEAKVLRSPGAQFGFDQAALDAVKQWKFKPATKNGKPVEVLFTVTVRFSLE